MRTFSRLIILYVLQGFIFTDGKIWIVLQLPIKYFFVTNALMMQKEKETYPKIDSRKN